MKQKSVNKYLSLLLIIILLGVTAFLLMRHQKQVLVEKAQEKVVPETTDQLVEEDWISFSHPRVLTETSFVLDMDILSSFETIEVIWSHPGNVETEAYTLTSFTPQSASAEYNISVVLGNLLAGENEYQVIARKSADQDKDEAKKLEFTMYFDLMTLPEVSPDHMSFLDAPETTGSEELELQASLTKNLDSVRVYSFYPETSKATFSRLRAFKRNDKSLTYNASEKLGNLFFGENVFVFEGLDEEGDVLLRKKLFVESTRLTLFGQLQQMFGEFSEVKGGWYVSSKLPWFSLRPTYKEAFYQADESSVIVPRPTLQYTVESDRNTPLCDYLGERDFEEEGVSYRAYSYEACQQYRFGVAVYDRFLSLLTHKPVEVVNRLDYKDISEKASTAFVMIETGDMPQERAQVIDLDTVDENFESEENEDVENLEPKKRYYVFQMLLTVENEYLDKKIGDIREEVDEERLNKVEEIRELLTAHGGDRLFTELLFTGVEAVDAKKE